MNSHGYYDQKHGVLVFPNGPYANWIWLKEKKSELLMWGFMAQSVAENAKRVTRHEADKILRSAGEMA